MKITTFNKILFFFIFSLLIITEGNSQVLISSGVGNPDESAMLDIQSDSRGLLIPRMSSAQRIAISNPKNGLLVFDYEQDKFYIYGKTISGSLGWNDLSTPAGIWETNSSDVYLSSTYSNVGIGTGSPTGKLVVRADASKAPHDALFEIQDATGNPIFVVTSEGARVYVKDVDKSKGVSGGFAVGRYGAAKGLPDTTFFMVTPDSTRVYSSQSGVSGGFAVGRYGAAKGPTTMIFSTNEDSTRIYTNVDAVGVSGGFAVGRYGAAKGADSLVFFTSKDSTRVYTGDVNKGVAGGFAVGRYGAAKGYSDNYMHMTPDNYLIGHRAGDSLTSGLYNIFLGYESGISDTSGTSNVFVGHKAGYNNTQGHFNVFLGNLAGYSSDAGDANTYLGTLAGQNAIAGNQNVFMGFRAGQRHNSGDNNIYLGFDAGRGDGTNAENGLENVYIGTEAGTNNQNGQYNVFLGYQAGFANEHGKNNVFLGYQAGLNNIGDGSAYDGNYNVFIGYQAGIGNVSGQSNVYIGEYAARDNVTGVWNTYLGKEAGLNQDSGKWNVLLGAQAGDFNQGGNANVMVGMAAGSYTSLGEENVLIGRRAGYNQGGNATDDISRNVCIGFETAFLGLGTNNVLVGYKAGRSLTTNTSTGNVMLGSNAGASETGSNRLYIDNLNTVTPLIYGEFDNNLLTFNGDVRIANGTSQSSLRLYNANSSYYTEFVTGFQSQNITYQLPSNDGNSGQILSTNGTGTLSWINGSVFGDDLGDHTATENLNMSNYNISNINYAYVNNVDIATGGWIGIASAAPRIQFDGTGDIELMSAEVGIGTTAPGAPLTVKTNSGGYALQIEESIGGEDWQFGVDGSGNLRIYNETVMNMYFDDGNSIGIGTSSINSKLTINGRLAPSTDGSRTLGWGSYRWSSVWAVDGTINTSDKRLKKNINSIDKGLSIILNLEPVSFYYKDLKNSRKKVGFIAQDVREIFPEAIYTDGESDILGINYSDFIPLLTKAIQEQELKIEEQNHEIHSQNKKIEDLEKQIQELKDLIQK